MRSEVVFQARQRLPGRYHLCMLCAKEARAIHRANTRIQDSINIAFGIIGQEGRSYQRTSLLDLQLECLDDGAPTLPIPPWRGRLT
jgi:hypothetical protein